ncbi:hypothetical protein UFOVP600_31 [uncultured Caudovirales phage]|uniref:Uncharacterized protein n=1 Tax=uncultured Caudovirales phage TaxID=2100421 RepID=A0A6J5N7P4_9CAUD|nr:hypothetical protein UFOVP600_31 [uncultured Caudovirales phage]
MTAVEFIGEQIKWRTNMVDIILEAKEMEKKQSHDYAEFAIRCDRMYMKILNFEDYLKLEKYEQ